MLANVANKLYWNTKLYTGLAVQKAKNALVKTERGDHLVEVLGTILVALVLLAIFRKQLISALDTVMKNVSQMITNLFQGSDGTVPTT